MKGRARSIALGALFMVALGSASGETLPVKGALDARIRTAPYNGEQVYRLYGFVGYAIELIFEEGETFAGEASGDLEGITLGYHSNHLILKPKAASVGTNLIIYTNRRAYRFEYSAVDHAPDPTLDEVMYAVRFLYPPPPATAAVPMPAEQTQRALARASEARARNLDYWYCGSASLKPVAASDDGVHTRLSFAAKGELPAIFLANDDGSESLLNFTVEQGDVVIHRIAKRFILRRGQLTGCVVNKAFSGGGERLQSGTIAPDVERERKGREP
jgi:type IV secretion system protein VirB9